MKQRVEWGNVMYGKSKGKIIVLFLLVLLMIGSRSGAVWAADVKITAQDIAEGLEFCRQYPVTLKINDQLVPTQVAPFIVKDMTLVPAREAFEAMGGVVDWDEINRIVRVTLEGVTVKLVIDSTIGYVNGQEKAMQIPAMIVQDKTMIPVRFVAESLSFTVGWEDVGRAVLITTPVTTPVVPDKDHIKIHAIYLEEKEDRYSIVLESEDPIGKYDTAVYRDPDRFGLDLAGATLSIEEGKLNADNELFSMARYSQFDADTVRLVVDLKKKVSGEVSLFEEGRTLRLDFVPQDEGSSFNQNPGNTGGTSTYGLDMLDSRAQKFLVAIDPGHGGSDVGSQAKRDGTLIMNEKDLNIDVALRLNAMLEASGVRTYMLRKDDSSINIYDRPVLANEAKADLYISVHNNSFPQNPNANGVEVFYNAKEREVEYGIYSKDLAQIAQKELVKALGITDRGAKNGSAYIVLNRTEMPAIIIEGAFLSNEGDLQFMLTDSFREKYAYAAAKAIIQTLNESVAQEKR